MNIKLSKATICGEINAIPSKSFAHRILICDFLAGKSIRTEFNGFSSKDILATANCLTAIRNGQKELDCFESGSTLRFLMPLCASIGGKFTFFGQGKLLSRPNDELFATLREKGIVIDQTKEHIKIKGKLINGEYKIRGDISSQYITGLLFALANLDGDSKIILTTPLSSKAYVDITIEVLKNYGVNIEPTEYGFFVKGNQKFVGGFEPEGDWSNMATFLVLGAVAGDVTVKGLNLNSVQGDKQILGILKSAGAIIEQEKGKIRVKKSELNGFTFSADSCPDLVPVASVLGAVAKGKTIIKDIKRLKIKESDRVLSTISTLKAFGIKAESDGDSIVIYGGVVKGGEINSFNDHRIVMQGAILGALSQEESKIFDASAVQKSYPTFFNDYLSVGGKAVEF